MFGKVNGVLFPGGGQDLDGSALLHTASFFVQKSLKSFVAGDYFPVAGHCQGFEVMLMAITGLNLAECMIHDPRYVAENVSLPLRSMVTSSRWFANMSASVAKILTSTPSTMNNHMWSTPLPLWNQLAASTPLRDFRIVSTTASPQNYGKEVPVVFLVSLPAHFSLLLLGSIRFKLRTHVGSHFCHAVSC